MFTRADPRTHTIVTVMNERYCQYLWQQFPASGTDQRHGHHRLRRGAHGQPLLRPWATSVNGVSACTPRSSRDHLPATLRPGAAKILLITNGVTHRRWPSRPTPPGRAGHRGHRPGLDPQPDQLARLKPFADDPAFRERFAAIKRANKACMADHIRAELGVAVDPTASSTSQAKRLHEYKRQLLNCLHILYIYDQLVENPNLAITPQTFLFAAKAAPAITAKLIIKLINAIAELTSTTTPPPGPRSRWPSCPTTPVSLAEKLMPAADISEQISTAGKEASGTGNMKFMLNGRSPWAPWTGPTSRSSSRSAPRTSFIFGLTAPEGGRAAVRLGRLPLGQRV